MWNERIRLLIQEREETVLEKRRIRDCDNLTRNTKNQHRFLLSLAKQYDCVGNKNDEEIDIPKGDDEGQGIELSASVKEIRVFDIHDDNQKQESSSTYEVEKKNLKLEDYPLAELLLMKEVVEGVYGKGTFNRKIGKEILLALGMHGDEASTYNIKQT